MSTGVTLPKIVYTTDVSVSPEAFNKNLPNEAKVVLSLNIDETGKAKDVQVVHSVNSKLDESVVAAVRQFRWRPATLDKQAIPMDMNLVVYVRH
jgi:TonB family protein